jgi:hypothetical protein
MAEEDIMIEDDAISLDDLADSSNPEDINTTGIVDYVYEKYNRAENYRENDEDRWLRAYRNYRGLYGPDVQFTEAEKSRVFVKTTKTKTLAAYGQIVDVLFAGNKFPISVEPTILPEGVSESVHADLQPKPMGAEPTSPYGFDGDGADLPKGFTATGIELGPLEEKLGKVEDLKEGAGTTPSTATFSPAMIAAKNMEKKIMDQLEESSATKHLRSTAFEMALFGTGVMKGPFAVDKEYPNWGSDGEYDPKFKTVPEVTHVSVWNLLIEVDETNLVPGQDLSVYPGKIFRRQGGAPGQAIFGTKFPNVAGENMQLFDKARQLSDESTGFPSFAHGQTGVMGAGRTASGISMLMNAASGGIKNVIKNVDDYLLKPLGQSLFSFNMQFDFDPKIKGDLEVRARGTESLMANEVRSQRLMQFLGVASNPALAPFAKFQYIIREIAKAMDLDPDKVTNNMEEAALQAKMLQEQQAKQKPPAGADPNDPTGAGGGTIGTGIAPTPNEQGFTGNAQPQQQAGTSEPQTASGEQEANRQLQ